MDKRHIKTYKAYGELFKQIIPESPLKEAFRKWNETTKIIKSRKSNCDKCGQSLKSKTPKDVKSWNKRRRELYSWQVRAEAVGIPLLPAHRPSKSIRQEWEYKIVEAEMEAII